MMGMIVFYLEQRLDFGETQSLTGKFQFAWVESGLTQLYYLRISITHWELSGLMSMESIPRLSVSYARSIYHLFNSINSTNMY